MKPAEIRVLVFGTFDGIHSGHDFFLQSAKTHGTKLIVGVARDAHVMSLKGHQPKKNEETRLKEIQKHPFVDQAFLCDELLNTFHAVKNIQPDKILLGHDQIDLEKALVSWMEEKGLSVPLARIDRK